RPYGIRSRRDPLADGAFGRRYRPLYLPSLRHQGDRGAGARAFARSGHARSRTRGHRRLRQHVGANGAVRARTPACAGPAEALAADLAWTRLHRKLRRAAARGVSLASIILALVTLQRLGELALSRYNTKKLLARGAIEVGANHYPLVVAVHAAWL